MTTAPDTFASHLKTARTALLELIDKHNGDLTHASYAEAGISLQIVPGVAARATAKPFYDANGRLVPGLELVVPNVGTASYLLLDAITAVESGELDKVLANNKSTYAQIDVMDGYPTIFAWVHE